ncbi:hypothetical protein [Nodosilinea sp. E11]|uniref:hypothetical protein n=1 Tax=Nodosilinea sp. E11 TaxID=3037479 RepID=UPI0029344ED5|nr:hypothetical protein [Nodosilinea sp. E11]WOD38977.1 hypothetical protein RRF56_22485 [Nodosilinea sp. E11]
MTTAIFRVFPSYRSGTLVRLQSVLPVTLDAQLLYPDQSPIADRNGAVVSTSGALARPLMFTTDATGRITVSGLKPGDYEIRLFTAAEELVIITIPPGHSGIFEAGSLITTPTYEDDEDDFEDDSFEDE